MFYNKRATIINGRMAGGDESTKGAVKSTDKVTLIYRLLSLYQPMTHICVMSSHKLIRMYMGGLILGVNTLHRLFPILCKGLRQYLYTSLGTRLVHSLQL